MLLAMEVAEEGASLVVVKGRGRQVLFERSGRSLRGGSREVSEVVRALKVCIYSLMLVEA